MSKVKYYLARYHHNDDINPNYIVINPKPHDTKRYDFSATIIFDFEGSKGINELFFKDELKEITKADVVKYKLLGYIKS